MLKCLAIDPSGEFDKGKGTTGIAIIGLDNDQDIKVMYHDVVESKQYDSQMDYWHAIEMKVIRLLQMFEINYVIIEDYILYASSAKAQINSGMETSKLIGMLMYNLSSHPNTKVMLHGAAQVMNRWANHILEHEGIIQIEGKRCKDMQGSYINPHALDAIRHGVHGVLFKIGKDGWIG